MIISRIIHIIRDLTFFGMLIFSIIHITKRAHTFITLHKLSLIHELDFTFLDTLYKELKKALSLKKQYQYNKNTHLKKIKEIKKIIKELTIIEEKYTKNSSALAFLGPIGTTAIILKEQDLAKKLTSISEKLHLFSIQ